MCIHEKNFSETLIENIKKHQDDVIYKVLKGYLKREPLEWDFRICHKMYKHDLHDRYDLVYDCIWLGVILVNQVSDNYNVIFNVEFIRCTDNWGKNESEKYIRIRQ